MKTTSCFSLLAGLAICIAALLPANSNGEATSEAHSIAIAIQELSAQQKVLVENQAQIDLKIAGIAEDMRVARIFISRSGGKK
ncbi:MAG: hypothetical protein QOD99_911 [Chthoniobacter sp.]|jgi:hypothetical protein|nr:hypothetical protein [Chthoniobacter sp.]